MFCRACFFAAWKFLLSLARYDVNVRIGITRLGGSFNSLRGIITRTKDQRIICWREFVFKGLIAIVIAGSMDNKNRLFIFFYRPFVSSCKVRRFKHLNNVYGYGPGCLTYIYCIVFAAYIYKDSLHFIISKLWNFCGTFSWLFTFRRKEASGPTLIPFGFRPIPLV